MRVYKFSMAREPSSGAPCSSKVTKMPTCFSRSSSVTPFTVTESL